MVTAAVRGLPLRRGRLTYLSHFAILALVNPESVLTSIDLPRDLHRRLHEVAARKGCSARQLIVRSIEQAVDEATPKRPRRHLSLNPPIVPSTGKPIDLSNEQIYDLIDFR
jgi:hypothetical protein